MEQLVNRRGVLYPKGKNYSKLYFTTVALENGSITFTIPSGLPTSILQSISYSRDGGTTWIDTNNVDNQLIIITVNNLVKDDSILWKGNGTATCFNNFGMIPSKISSQCRFDVEGNIMSLLYGDNFYGKVEFPNGSTYTFCLLFCGCVSVINANNLILPATTLLKNCYYGMFDSCDSLITAPKLLATTLASYCCAYMFNNCRKLITAPELPATILANNCYANMFKLCLLLVIAPELPATTLAPYCYDSMFARCYLLTTVSELPATTLATGCYQSMFSTCTSLTIAPELSATTLVSSCYIYMFQGCRNLNYIKCLATDISANNCTYSWVSNVSATGTFVKDASMTSWSTGNNGIPSGWTVEDA